MDWQDDLWVTEQAYLDNAVFHALGVVSFQWNMCEQQTYQLLEQLSGVGGKTGGITFGRLSADETWKRVSALFRLKFPAPAASEAIKRISAFHVRCRENRNAYAHYTVMAQFDDAPSSFRLYKQNRTTREYQRLNDALPQIRQVADDILALHGLLHRLSSFAQFGKLDHIDLKHIPELPASVVLCDEPDRAI